MAVFTNQAAPSIDLHQSFSIRLEKAKKAAIEAALKHRNECLKTADPKLHPASHTELLSTSTSKSEDVENTKNTEIISSSEPVLSTQVLNHHPNATGQPTEEID